MAQVEGAEVEAEMEAEEVDVEGVNLTRKKNGTSGANNSHDKSNVQCYNCQDFGHYAAECKNPRRKRNQESNLVQDNDEPALFLSAFENKEEEGEVFLNEENVSPKLKTKG